MQFAGQYQESLTIPTGATSGARITINLNNNGSIDVYDVSNALVEEVNPDRGFISFSSTSYVQLNSAGIEFGSYNPNNDTIVADGTKIVEGNLGLPNNQPYLEIDSASIGGFDQLQLRQISGTAGQKTGSGLVPRVTILDFAQSTPADLYISGNVYATDVSGNIDTWQKVGTTGAPAFKTGWSGTNTFFSFGGGDGFLKFRKLPFDMVRLEGLCTSASGAGTTIFTLPSGLFNPSFTTFGWCLRNRSSTLSPVNFAIDTSGNLFLEFTPAAGDQYQFTFDYSIGNAP